MKHNLVRREVQNQANRKLEKRKRRHEESNCMTGHARQKMYSSQSVSQEITKQGNTTPPDSGVAIRTRHVEIKPSVFVYFQKTSQLHVNGVDENFWCEKRSQLSIFAGNRVPVMMREGL